MCFFEAVKAFHIDLKIPASGDDVLEPPVHALRFALQLDSWAARSLSALVTDPHDRWHVKCDVRFAGRCWSIEDSSPGSSISTPRTSKAACRQKQPASYNPCLSTAASSLASSASLVTEHVLTSSGKRMCLRPSLTTVLIPGDPGTLFAVKGWFGQGRRTRVTGCTAKILA